MGRKGKKIGKKRLDKFYRLAKEQGYRSRASYKLIQLNRRFNFLSSASDGVIDLCAAPGGWMQVVRKMAPVEAAVVGVDLLPIRPVTGCVALVGDITEESTHAELKKVLKGRNVDVVLNDGSPNMGAAWLQDAYSQNELTLSAVRLASSFLKRGGCFVTKVFRSTDYNSLIFVMHQLFSKVVATKPLASRAESAEIYVVATEYKAPAYIDPKLLNPKYVFRELGTVDPLSTKKDLSLATLLKTRKKSKPSREGYPDAGTTLYNEVPLLEFVFSSTPVALLARSTAIKLPDPPHLLLDWEGTTEEVRACFADTKQLGRNDFKLLLKYRTQAKAFLAVAAPATVNGEDVESKPGMKNVVEQTDKGELEAAGADTDLSEEEAAAYAAVAAREKRKRRKERKRKAALQRKIDLKIITRGEVSETPDEKDLFNVRVALKADPKLDSIAEAADADNLMEDVSEDTGKEDEEELAAELAKPIDPEEEKENAMRRIEEEADNWYTDYLAHRDRDRLGTSLDESREEIRRRKARARRALRERKGPESKSRDENSERNVEVISEDDFSLSDEEETEQKGTAFTPGSREAALWFSQPVFAKVLGLEEDEEDTEDSNKDIKNLKSTSEPTKNSASDAIDDVHLAARKAAQKQIQKEVAQLTAEDGNFEVAPAPQAESESEDDMDSGDDASSFHSSDYDSDEKAEMVAIGREMRTSKKRRMDILDDAYNRYVFDDPEGLPRWFTDTEARFRERPPPVTKEQVAECKAYIKSLEMEPTKKEAEAKARKRRRNERKLELVRRQAEKIAEQSDLSGRSRINAIDKLYREASKAVKKKNRPKNYVVVKAGGSHLARRGKPVRGGRIKLVDARLKADTRGIKKARARKGTKGRKAKS